MRRKFSTSLALLGIALGLALGCFAPQQVVAQSILPGETTEDGGNAITDCPTLRKAMEANPKDLEGKELALKIRCGRMVLGDLPHYFKHAISFVLNIIGTLAVIAVIRAGYIFMLSKDKEYKDGRQAIIQVVVGILVATLSFTAAQIVLQFLFAVQNV